jgi:hypothetical protein
MEAPVIQLLILLVVLGLVLYLVNQLPIDNNIKVVIRVVAILILIIWLLSAVGVVSMTEMPRFR